MGSHIVRTGRRPESVTATSAVADVLRSAGEPLEADIRQFMEPRFAADFSRLPVRASAVGLSVGRPDDPAETAADGLATDALSGSRTGQRADFSRIRVHTGARAAEAARAVGARAFTVGTDIVFGFGEYQPRSPSGRRLLAHELAHVAQGNTRTIRRQPAPASRGEDERVPHTIRIPAGLASRRQLLRYVETVIFGHAVNLPWSASTSEIDVVLAEPAKHVGRAVRFSVRRAELARYGRPPSADTKAALDQDYSALDKGDRARIDAEVARRYSAGTGERPGLPIGRGEHAKAEIWAGYRRQLLADKRRLDALPYAIKSLLGGPENFAPEQYDILIRLAGKLSQFSEADLKDFDARSLDLAELEASIDRYLAAKAAREREVEHRETVARRLYGTKALYEQYKKLGKLPSAMERAAAGYLKYHADKVTELGAEAAKLRQQEIAEFTANLTKHGFADQADFERTLDAYEKVFLQETVEITVDYLGKLDRQFLDAQQRYSDDAVIDTLLAQVKATPAPALVEKANSVPPKTSPYPAASKQDLEAADLRARAKQAIRALPGHPLVADDRFPHLELATADRKSAKATILAYLRTRRANVNESQGNLRSDPKAVYKLSEVLVSSMEIQGIEPDSAAYSLINDRRAKYVGNEAWIGVLLGVVGLALALLIPVGGVLGAGAALGAAGIGVYQTISEFKEYQKMKKFADTGLGGEPNFTWVLLAALGAGLDLGGALRAVDGIWDAIVLFNKAPDLTKFAASLDTLPAKVRQNVLRAAVAKIEADQALLRFGAKAGGSLHSGVAGLNAVPEFAYALYALARRGRIGFDRFMTEMKAAKLIDAAQLPAEQLTKLKAMFEEAREVVKEVTRAGRQFGLTEDEIGAFIKQISVDPSLSVGGIKTAMADTAKAKPAVAAGRKRTAQPKAPLDVRERVTAAEKLADVERRIAESTASIRAEGEAAAAANKELKAVSASPPKLPESLTERLRPVHRLESLEEKIEAIDKLSGAGNLAVEEQTYLAWRRRMLELEKQAKDATGTAADLNFRLPELLTEKEAAGAALREASKDLIDVMRTAGPNYKARSKLAVDQVMSQATWDALQRKPRLATDHLVSLDRLSKLPQLNRLLALYTEASPAVKAEIKAALEALGDRPDNLYRMNAVANGPKLKGKKSWHEIDFKKAAEFGYTADDVKRMRLLEDNSLAAILQRVEELTARFTARVHGAAKP
ncbi:DUF4157 domain-containing protein [Amycolatopsis anabasis]|uniref:eCIS core domain-containing protein n=1 Tax=Amycolatopsis anabasis TaxID=1840409 RepID=UPI001C553BCC|nr:DUF4157 domain-containing protein [Amycolatopsis anabasis]